MRDPQQPVYEIRCNHCNVSFPPETKVCLHCGDRLRSPRQVLQTAPGLEDAFRHLIPSDPKPTEPSGVEPVDPREPPLADFEKSPESEEEQPRSWVSTILGNFVWIAAALLFTVSRACQGG